MSVFMPVPHSFDYCRFVVNFEIRKCESSSYVLFQDCSGFLGSLEILDRTALNLQIALGSTNILTVLSLPIHDNGMCFHLYVFLNFFQQCFVVFIITFLVKSIPKYFIIIIIIIILKFIYLSIYLFIYLFLAVLGLRFCARAFSSCVKGGPLFIALHGPLTIVASLVVEHRLQTCRLSSCGSRAQLLRGMWDLPRPGPEPVSPALAGRFSTTAPPGKPILLFLILL